jgi:hypothetical protein
MSKLAIEYPPWLVYDKVMPELRERPTRPIGSPRRSYFQSEGQEKTVVTLNRMCRFGVQEQYHDILCFWRKQHEYHGYPLGPADVRTIAAHTVCQINQVPNIPEQTDGDPLFNPRRIFTDDEVRREQDKVPAGVTVGFSSKNDERLAGMRKQRVIIDAKAAATYAGLMRGIPASNQSSLHEAVKWVARNFSKSVSDIDPTGVPDEMAVSMLEYAKSNPRARDVFWGNIFGRFIPSRQQIEQQERFSDDNRQISETLEFVEKASVDARQQPQNEDIAELAAENQRLRNELAARDERQTAALAAA